MIPEAIEQLFVDLFLDAHAKAPARITLDLDATDDPIHGHQEGRFFHGFYDGYCYLPLYVVLRRASTGGQAAPLEHRCPARARPRRSPRIVTRIRARWPRVRILLRADSGFRPPRR